MILEFIAAAVFAANPTLNPGGDPPIKLFAEDGAAGDFFGQDVAISGFTAVIGAIYDDDNGEDSGAAYLFDIITGNQIMKLLPDDGEAGEEFGFSTAMHGSIAVVGAWKDDDNGFESGSAYLFDVTTGEQLHKLLPDDGVADARFGIAVDIHNGTVIVGAYRDDDNGMWSGSAYLFDAETGEQLMKLLPEVGAPEDIFGRSVAIHANRALIGAPQTDENGNSSGSAHLFDVGSGLLIEKIIPADSQPGDQFGYGVDVFGNNAIMSARGDDDAGDAAGSAYIFNLVSGAQLAKLYALDGGDEDYFGLSIAIAGERVCVTALRDDENGTDSGSAYLYGSTCIADINGDGLLNILDFIGFQDLWKQQHPSTDCDNNDSFDILDFLCYLQIYQQGCP